MLPTQRLSPKHQVTLPRDLRGLASRDGSAPSHVRGVQHALPANGADGAPAPVVLLMTEAELRRREDRILADPQLDGSTRLALITRLNGGAARMAVDAQQRIVLPAHLVAWLRLDRDVFLNDTNTVVQLWNPQEYLRWSGLAAGVAVDPLLTTYLTI